MSHGQRAFTGVIKVTNQHTGIPLDSQGVDGPVESQGPLRAKEEAGEGIRGLWQKGRQRDGRQAGQGFDAVAEFEDRGDCMVRNMRPLLEAVSSLWLAAKRKWGDHLPTTVLEMGRSFLQP